MESARPTGKRKWCTNKNQQTANEQIMNLCARFLNILAASAGARPCVAISGVDFAELLCGVCAVRACLFWVCSAHSLRLPAPPEFNLSLTATNLGVDGFA